MLPARDEGGLAPCQTSTKGRLDRPELNGTGYDFGNGTFVAGSLTGGGRLEFT